MKKSVLILTMYYPPLNLVPVNRIRLMVDAFIRMGWHVTVMTRSYNKLDHNSADLEIAKRPSSDKLIEEKDRLRIVRLPYSDQSIKLSRSSKMPPVIRGYYNMKQVDVYHHNFYDEVEQFLKNDNNNYELAISSYGPSIMLKLTKIIDYYCNNVVLDYRDSYITERDTSFLLKMKQSIVKKLNRRVSGAIYASEGIMQMMEKQSRPINSTVIMNGVSRVEDYISDEDHESLNILESLKYEGKKIFLHAGSLYKGQNLEYLVQCVKKLPNNQVVCLGNKEDVPGVINLKKVSIAASRRAMRLADALLLPVWEGRYTGFSGKLLEYLYCNKPVICGPNPQDDLINLLRKSPNSLILAGKLEIDIENIKEMLKLEISVNDDLIEFLSADFQGQKLVKFVESL